MKSIVFAGKSLEALKRFPAAAKREAGYQLDAFQKKTQRTSKTDIDTIKRNLKEIKK